MSEALHFIAAAAIVALGMAAMAVGQILRKRSITHCGGASMTFRGERIRCPGCRGKKRADCEESVLEQRKAKPKTSL